VTSTPAPISTAGVDRELAAPAQGLDHVACVHLVIQVAGSHALALDAQAQASVAGRLRARVGTVHQFANGCPQPDRQVLPGLEQRHGMAVRGRKVERPDDPPPQANHAVADAQPFMHGLFAGVERVVVACGGGVHGRLPGWRGGWCSAWPRLWPHQARNGLPARARP